jgi:uncharacterized protein YehS (DUF1456 family)
MPRRDPVRDVREKKTVLLDVTSNRVFQILASDEFARFLNGLVVQTENNNQSLPTKELCNVI